MMYESAPHQLLSNDDIIELTTRIGKGDAYAMKFLIENYLGFIIKKVRHIPSIYKYDAVHDIMPRIIKYVEKYDYTKGSFPSYINRAVELSLLSRYNIAKHEKARRVKDRTIAWTMYRHPITPRDAIIDTEYKEVRKKAIADALSKLSIREQYIIIERFLKGKQLKQLAKEEQLPLSTMHYNTQLILKRMRISIEHYYDDLR